MNRHCSYCDIHDVNFDPRFDGCTCDGDPLEVNAPSYIIHPSADSDTSMEVTEREGT